MKGGARPLPDLKKDARMWLSRATNTSLAPPDWLSVNLTLRCNLACVMCTTCYDAPELTTGEVLDLIDQAALWGVKVFNPLGGEPFVRRDLEDILDHASRRDLYVTLTTNATLISAERAARVARIPADKLHVNVSIDGLEAAHDEVRGAGAFARAIAGYRNLRAADHAVGNVRRTIGANVILHRKNLATFPALLSFLADEGVDGVQVLNLFRDDEDSAVGGMWFTPEDLPALEALCLSLAEGSSPVPLRTPPEDLRLIPRYYREGLRPLEAPCWAGWKELYVNADGGAIMCDGSLDFLAGRFGSVRESTLRELWASPALAERRSVVKRCTTPCIQGCYLRRESDSAVAITRAVASHVARDALSRGLPGALRRAVTRLHPPSLAGVPLTVELTDVPSEPGHPLLERLLHRSGVSGAALVADPDLLGVLRDRGVLDTHRGFLGVELLEALITGIQAAGVRFPELRLGWRGDPLLHPELARILAVARGPGGRAAFDRVTLMADSRLLGTATRATLAAHPDVRRTPTRTGDGPVVSWDARLTISCEDEHLQYKIGNVHEEGFGAAWARYRPLT